LAHGPGLSSLCPPNWAIQVSQIVGNPETFSIGCYVCSDGTQFATSQKDTPPPRHSLCLQCESHIATVVRMGCQASGDGAYRVTWIVTIVACKRPSGHLLSTAGPIHILCNTYPRHQCASTYRHREARCPDTQFIPLASIC
jgi:hypothetical protein